MMNASMQLACVLLPVAAFPILAACADQEPTRALVPVEELVAAGGPGSQDGWFSVGSVQERPALSLYADGRPMLVLTCSGIQTKVQARGFEPKQAWPQPDMVVRFGATSRSASPDVRNIGDQVAYELSFRISDDVMEAIRTGASIIVEFSGQSRTTQPIPEDQAGVFAERCESRVPAGMRRSPPASQD